MVQENIFQNECDFMNGKIITADLIFEEPCGKNGLNFLLRLTVKDENKMTSVLDYNPTRLPQLLEKLELPSFCALEGTLVKMTPVNLGESTDDVKITNILDSSSEEDWFANDNGVYFGSKIDER